MKRQQGFGAVEALLILVIVGLLGFVGWYVHSANSRTDQTFENTTKASNSVAAQATKQEPQSTPTQVTAKEHTPTASEKAAIQAAAKAYLSAQDSSSNESFSLPQEQATVSENRDFAIQIYCGPPPSDCSQMWLQKSDNTWKVLGVDIDTQPNVQSLNQKYGWPLDFF